MVKIFLSHSNIDKATAALLAELFRTALHLPKSDIRCTSVDGYRLPAGVNTDEQLRREVLDAPVLVGLVSQHSFESAYVLFELGARWGKNAFLVPLLAPGVSSSVLKGPLSGFNALACDSAAQVHQLVQDVAAQLDLTLRPAAEYQEQIEKIVALDVPISRRPDQTVSVKPEQEGVGLSDKSPYSDAEVVITQHCESQWPSDFEMRLHCEKKQREAVDRLIHQSSVGVPKDVFEKIRASAAQTWPTDYEMRLHTEDNQLNAYRELQKSR